MLKGIWIGSVAAFAASALTAASAQEAPPNPVAPALQQYALDSSNRMTVPVRVNGSEPMPFVVDTGAERTVIAHDFAKRLALSVGRPLRLATITGPADVDSYVIPKLTTDTVNIEGLEAPGLERQNLGAYGLLGIDSLENHKVLLNFRQGTMHVLPSAITKKSKKTAFEKDMIIVSATRKAGRMILSNAYVGTTRVDIILDTGASSSMGNYALRRHLRGSERLMGFAPVVLKSVTGEDLKGDFTQIRRINVGGIEISGLPVVFTDNYAFEALDLKKRPAILLGMDAMKMFDRIVIDFANRRVGFDLPNGVVAPEWLLQSASPTDSTGTILRH